MTATSCSVAAVEFGFQRGLLFGQLIAALAGGVDAQLLFGQGFVGGLMRGDGLSHALLLRRHLLFKRVDKFGQIADFLLPLGDFSAQATAVRCGGKSTRGGGALARDQQSRRRKEIRRPA